MVAKDSLYLMMVSAHNAYIIAKDIHPDTIKDGWPNFQNFIEEIVSDLIGDTRAARKPAMGYYRGLAQSTPLSNCLRKRESVVCVL